jgi:hypothetical protein
MTDQPIASIIHHFSSIDDPRRDQHKKQRLSAIFQLDTLIDQHQSQLKKLNNLKQACLAKIFSLINDELYNDE